MPGCAKPIALPPPRLMTRRPEHRVLALLLIFISVSGSLTGLCLWLAGDGHAGLQAGAAAALAIMGLLIFP